MCILPSRTAAVMTTRSHRSASHLRDKALTRSPWTTKSSQLLEQRQVWLASRRRGSRPCRARDGLARVARRPALRASDRTWFRSLPPRQAPPSRRSLDEVPLPMPPIDGLHSSCERLDRVRERSVDAAILAAAARPGPACRRRRDDAESRACAWGSVKARLFFRGAPPPAARRPSIRCGSRRPRDTRTDGDESSDGRTPRPRLREMRTAPRPSIDEGERADITPADARTAPPFSSGRCARTRRRTRAGGSRRRRRAPRARRRHAASGGRARRSRRLEKAQLCSTANTAEAHEILSCAATRVERDARPSARASAGAAPARRSFSPPPV